MSDTETLYHPYLNCNVHLIGAGGIGSNLLPLLVRCGPRRLTIWDDDDVAAVNLAQQNFVYNDIGRSKARVLEEKALDMDPSLSTKSMKCRVTASTPRLDGLVVAGVDSIKGRHEIFDAVRRQADHIDLFIDGRLSRSRNEWAEVYFIDPKRDDDVGNYRGLLYDEREMMPQGPRPTKLSAHTPIMLAALAGTGLARWVNEKRHPWKVTWDGLTFTLVAYERDTT
jgi:hypothetical protein